MSDPEAVILAAFIGFGSAILTTLFTHFLTQRQNRILALIEIVIKESYREEIELIQSILTDVNPDQKRLEKKIREARVFIYVNGLKPGYRQQLITEVKNGNYQAALKHLDRLLS